MMVLRNTKRMAQCLRQKRGQCVSPQDIMVESQKREFKSKNLEAGKSFAKEVSNFAYMNAIAQ